MTGANEVVGEQRTERGGLGELKCVSNNNQSINQSNSARSLNRLQLQFTAGSLEFHIITIVHTFEPAGQTLVYAVCIGLICSSSYVAGPTCLFLTSA